MYGYSPWLEIDFLNESSCIRRVGLEKGREMARSFHRRQMLLNLDWESLSSSLHCRLTRKLRRRGGLATQGSLSSQGK